VKTSPSYEYIDTFNALKDLTVKVKKSKQVAVDTEADSLHHYFEKVCLLQLTINNTNYIVDPLAKLDLSDFLNNLSEKPLILHGADYDLRMLQSSFGFRPKNRIFDTMIAAKLLGYNKFSLAALVNHFFNITLKKQGQKSNWSKRPLSESQLEYASYDTHFLEEIAANLKDELKKLNRYNWFHETVDFMVQSTENNKEPDMDNAWRIKGTGFLKEHQLIFLKQIWHWREKIGAEKDIPCFKIMGNSHMVELSAWTADNPSAKAADFPGLPKSYSVRRIHQLEKAIEKARNTKKTNWPKFRIRTKPVHNKPGYKKLVKALKEECVKVAEKLKMNPSDIANNAALELLARERPSTLKEVYQYGHIMKWQAKLLYPCIQKIFK
jgi:ribonuclease D